MLQNLPNTSSIQATRSPPKALCHHKPVLSYLLPASRQHPHHPRAQLHQHQRTTAITTSPAAPLPALSLAVSLSLQPCAPLSSSGAVHGHMARYFLLRRRAVRLAVAMPRRPVVESKAGLLDSRRSTRNTRARARCRPMDTRAI